MTSIKTGTINTPEQIGKLTDLLVLFHTSPDPVPTTLYIDLEGMNLCRHGSISILTLLVEISDSYKYVYLIDVHTLGAQAFSTAGDLKKTLKDILQDPNIPKVFFDVRNDSDALYALFGVALQGIEDVQLMESATRMTTMSRKFVAGLAKCIEKNSYACFGASGLTGWKQAKARGEKLFRPDLGGSYAVFNERPIPEDIVEYCVGDVLCLPKLREEFLRGKSSEWEELINEVSKGRVAESQKGGYRPHGREKAIAPWSKEQNRMLDQMWRMVSGNEVGMGYGSGMGHPLGIPYSLG